MRGPPAGPRVLLRRLREIMAEPISAQDRLDKIVTQIAANVVAEVCSVYVLRSDGVLELYATEGLKPEAVHHAALRIGQGLVGTIAAEAGRSTCPTPSRIRPIATCRRPARRSTPPSSACRSCGPAGRSACWWSRTGPTAPITTRRWRRCRRRRWCWPRCWRSANWSGWRSPARSLDLKRPITITGVGLCEGVGLGHVVLHEPRVVVTELIAEDAEAEMTALDAAIASLRLFVDDMLSRDDIAETGEHREVLEAYRMFAHDRGWVRRMNEAIRNGLTAEAAVEKVQSDTRARLQRQTDPFLRDRLHDFDDLANRLLRVLMNKAHGPSGHELPRDAIIVARNMGAAELLDYDRERVRGLVLEEGGADQPRDHRRPGARHRLGRAERPTWCRWSRTAMRSSSTGWPARSISGRRPMSRRPMRKRSASGRKRQEQYRLLRDKPAMTRDGERVKLLMNAGLVVDLPHLAESGAEGIGLFRTELQFMIAARMPKLGEQRALYVPVLEAAGERPVTFRTLDIGGDKVLPYLRTAQEENPAMGWRAIRLGLDRPGLLRMQLRALLQAAAGRELRIMLPMVTELWEISETRELIDREMAHLRRHGHEEPTRLLIGAMVEVPSLLWQLDGLAELVDFISVGSNDLHQFMTASDRGNIMVAGRFDPLSRPFLRALRQIVKAAGEAKLPVTLCGEMAGSPLAAMALIGLGYRSLSMSAAAIGPVKAMTLALDAGKVGRCVETLLADGAGKDGVRTALADFAVAEGIPF